MTRKLEPQEGKFSPLRTTRTDDFLPEW